MEFLDYSGQAGFLDATEGESRGHESRSQPHQSFAQAPTTGSLQEPGKVAYYDAAGQQQVNCDIKPRLTKEQHDVLEEHYSRQPKPNTITKKEFAEDLGVSLDKVNNWFQNRRAKSKQDAKKAQGALNLLHHQQVQQYNFGSGSDSETSPAFSTTDFMSAMSQYAPEDQTPNGLGILPVQHFADQGYFGSMSNEEHDHFQQDYPPHPHVPQEMFDSPQELNRRTLTQEQFDAFAHTGNMMQGSENFDIFHSGFAGNQEVYSQVFPELQGNGFKPQQAFAFPHDSHAPLSSHDSTIPSSASESSVNTFPSSNGMRHHGDLSSASSEYTDSRSSSVSMGQQDDSYMHMSMPQQSASNTSTSQWQPGQSVPVDFHALNEQFRQAAAQARPSPQVHEQPLAWPADEAYVRRDSQTSTMLAQSMSNVGIRTPQAQHTAVFASPPPAASIAARRQRPRPAALGLASLRSQSYSGTMQPASPGQMPQPHALTPGAQPLRRIRSSNLMGGVSQGRVQKTFPGAAQRSPLAWTFADSMNSPKAARHVSGQSSGSLAPPTPMSPSEFPRPEQSRGTFSSWQNAPGNVRKQPSIHEVDFEHEVPFAPSAAGASQNFSSPPHTPMYPQHAFVQQRIGNNVITENTPPQSAPAAQQCFFPSKSTITSQPPMQQHIPPQPQVSAPQQMQSFVPATQPQMMDMSVSEPQAFAPNGTYAPVQQFVAPTTSTPMELPMQFANGVPIVDANGQLRMAFPPQMHQFIPHGPPPPHQAPVQVQQMPQQMPQQHQFQMYTTPGASPSTQMPAQLPKQAPQPAAELFVHEYSPPQEIKRTATPRKTVDSGPKNYTFANQGPEHFGKDKVKKDSKASSTTVSSSPASSSAS